IALAGNLGFEPELVAFDKAYENIAHDGPGREPARPVAPWVLVVDAWALGDPRTSDMVRRIDRANRPWLAVMAVLAGDDPQTQRDRKRLTERLRDTLSWHRHLDDVRHTARGAAAQGIAQPDAFAWLFAELAKSCYLRYLDSIQDDSPRPSSGPARRHGERRTTSD
ncbi:FxsC protein, partial [Streptomyces nigra]